MSALLIRWEAFIPMTSCGRFEWREQTEKMAEAYFHAWENLSPKEAFVDLAERNLNQVLTAEPEFDQYESDYAREQKKR